MAGAAQYSPADYVYNYIPGLPGQVYGMENGKEDVTGIGIVDIGFGVFVAYAGTDTQDGNPKVKLPTASTDLIIGVSMWRHRTPWINGTPAYITSATDTQTTAYYANYPIPIRKVGKLYVPVTATVKYGDPVYVRYAAGAGLLQIGSASNASVAGENFLLAGAKFYKAGTSGSVAVVDLNLPA